VFWNGPFDLAAILKPWLIEHKVELKERYRAYLRAHMDIALVDAEAEAAGGWTPLLVQRRAVAWEIIENADKQPENFRVVTGETIGPHGAKHVEGWSIVWRPKKGWALSPLHKHKGMKAAMFYDAMPFYATAEMGTGMSLDVAMRKHLGYGKTDVQKGIIRASIGAEKGYYEAHEDKIIEYCIDDCRGTAALFAKTIYSFEQIDQKMRERGAGEVPFPKQPWSRASVGRAMIRAIGSLEETVKAWKPIKQTGVGDFIRACYHGAIILTIGVGTYYDVTDFDLGSAYPAECVTFPSLEDSTVCAIDDPDFKDCFFKFYEVKMAPTPRLAFREGKDTLKYHLGGPERVYHVTQHDLDAFDLWGDKYTIVRGYGIRCPLTEKPLEYFKDIYDLKATIKKEYGKDSVEYLNIKTALLNGIYGILAQHKPRDGRYTNFVYAAYITSGTRLRLWSLTKKLQDAGATVLGWMTDGILAVDVPEAMKTHDETLGGWDSVEFPVVTIFENGIREEGGFLKKRGDPKLKIQDIRESDDPFFITHDSGPLSLKQAILWGKPEDIGVWKPTKHEFRPSTALMSAGLKVPKELATLPLKEWYHHRWMLEFQASDAPAEKVVSAWEATYGAGVPIPVGARVLNERRGRRAH